MRREARRIAAGVTVRALVIALALLLLIASGCRKQTDTGELKLTGTIVPGDIVLQVPPLAVPVLDVTVGLPSVVTTSCARRAAGRRERRRDGWRLRPGGRWQLDRDSRAGDLGAGRTRRTPSRRAKSWRSSTSRCCKRDSPRRRWRRRPHRPTSTRSTPASPRCRPLRRTSRRRRPRSRRPSPT